MSNTYIGITIGRIYKTFQNVRRTRELWAASFCFSFIMRNINQQLRIQGIKPEDFILPYFEEKEKDKLFNLKGFGFFPDRLIFKSKEGDLKLSIDKSFELLSVEMEKVIDCKKDEIAIYLKNYFQICFIEKSLDDSENARVILALTPYLDTLEQQNKFQAVEPEPNLLFEFFKQINSRKNKSKKSFLYDHYEIEDINGNKRVESLIEIATRELAKNEKVPNYQILINKNLWDENGSDIDVGNNGKDSDTEFLDALIKECARLYPEDKDNPFQTYHKYYCILQADGDKMGTALKGLSSVGDVQVFSNHLTKWAQETYKEVKENYDGVPIYIGGDDLLCIVPVCNGNRTVFDLIQKIDSIFKTEFTSEYPSLSFGLSITYYKYPLAEAFAKAYELLKQAKKEGGNRVAVQIIKHSGSELVSVFDKASGLFKQTLNHFLTLLDDKEAANSSISYKLRENEKVFAQIGLSQERISHFVNHITDSKDEGKTEADYQALSNNNEKFIRLVKDTIYGAYKQKADEVLNKNMDKISEDAMKEIYSMLRIVKFVKGLDDDKS